MENKMQIFSSENFGQLRTVEINGEIYFVGKDVALILGYKDTADALKTHVDAEDKLTRQFTDSGQAREMIVINESGLYSLILSSKLPKAKEFKRWVTSEILPSIRKYGGYFIQPQLLKGNEIQIVKTMADDIQALFAGVSHELVRHRLASFTQESTRYRNYASDKFGGELTFIKPCFWADINSAKLLTKWQFKMSDIERLYMNFRNRGVPPEQARAILPNSLKTEIVITCNLREWRHFLKLRTAKDAHPQIRQVATMILEIFKEKLPVIFDDIGE